MWEGERSRYRFSRADVASRITPRVFWICASVVGSDEAAHTFRHRDRPSLISKTS